MATCVRRALHLTAAAACAASSELPSQALRPNIVWVMADDLGWGEPGLYPSTSPHGRIDTPHLDQFGREGMVFTEAYAGYTVCAPSRTAFFTGRHAGHFTQLGWNGQELRPDQNVTTVAHVLKRAGYQTGAFGKVAPLTSPLEQGFDSFLGQVDQALCHNMYPAYIDTNYSTLNFKLAGNQAEVSRELCMASPERYNYTIDVFHEAGMAWLEKAARREPFFLYLSYTIPHAGGWHAIEEQGAPVPTDLQYAGKAWPDVEKDHAAVITYLDAKVGDLMARLKDLKIDEHTLVFFASDNGAHLEGGHSPVFFNSTGGLTGHKRSLYEGGVRSPTMLRWPAVVAAGQRLNHSWGFWDVLPTLSELAGARVPGTAEFKGLDSISIVPLLLGHAMEGREEFIYFTWSAQRNKPPGYSVRRGNWKGVVQACADSAGLRPSMADEMEIYDLSTDPFETSDVAARHGAIEASLKQLVISKNVTCMCYQCDYPWDEVPRESVPGEEVLIV